MRSVLTVVGALSIVLLGPSYSLGQAGQQPPAAGVPRVMSLSGVFAPADGGRPAPVEAVTVAIYDSETGGAPIWQETQSIRLEADGRYTIVVGSTFGDGIPADIFSSAPERWVGTVFSRGGELEGPRVRLTSVPYALRASNADTLGGLPASAFLRAPAGGAKGDTGSSVILAAGEPAPADVLPGFATSLAKYVDANNVGSSAVWESGGLVGVNTSAPLDIMHVLFNNTAGNVTGYAVQNLGNTAASYSGMLFYDQNGALGQFQGFNNSTHEYRINNVARVSPGGAFNGSINFMVGGTSRFLVNSTGQVGINTTTPTSRLMVNGDVGIQINGDFRPLGTNDDGVRWVDANGSIMAHMHRWGASNDNLYVTNAGGANLTGVFLAPSATSWTSTSDERLKSDVEPVTGILGKIQDIRVVGFNMAAVSIDKDGKKMVIDRETGKRTTKSGVARKQQIGSIAQDWLKHFPELVVEPNGPDQFYGLNYERIGVVALGGVKELSELAAQKDAEIKALTDRVSTLEQLVRQLLSQLPQRVPQQ